VDFSKILGIVPYSFWKKVAAASKWTCSLWS